MPVHEVPCLLEAEKGVKMGSLLLNIGQRKSRPF